MKLLLIGHEDRYAVEQLQLALFPLEPMEPMTAEFEGDGAVSRLIREGDSLIARTAICLDGVTRTAVVEMPACDETVSLRRQILQQSYFKAALPFLKKAPAWGALSGVRPTKLTTRCLMAGLSDEETIRHMENTYFVTPQRAKLSLDCSKATVEAASRLSKDDVSLYVGIPFCPTRCAYCSFVSRTIGKRTELMEPYLEALH